MTLRDYQHKMVDDTRDALKRVRAVLIQSECGSGKGTVTAYMINRAVQRGKRVLFLVRGRDRVSDMHDRVARLGIPHGVLMGGQKRERSHATQIASIDTLHRMQHKPKADLLIIDECHFGLSPTFRQVLDHYASVKIIGMSATPSLGNGKPLGLKSGGIFEEIVHGPSVNDLIGHGHLVGSRVFAPPPPEGMQGLKKKKTGEFDEGQGASICDNRKVIGDMIENYRRHSSDRKFASFGFHQKHAFHIAEQFREAGIACAYVDAETPDGDIHTPGTRKFIWDQYDNGDLVGVSSVATIDTGWDHSICKALLFLSKTAAFPRFRQRLGRGSRPHKGFTDFHVHDHTGNLWEFLEDGPYFESEIDWQLDGDAVKKKGDDDPAMRVSTCKRPQPIPDDGVPRWFRGDTANGYMLCCYHTFKAGPKECPRCGLPVTVDAPDVKVEAGELQEVTAAMKQKSAAQLAHEARMKLRYLELSGIARSRLKKDGTPWSPKWATMAFKSEFGRWPEKHWIAGE